MLGLLFAGSSRAQPDEGIDVRTIKGLAQRRLFDLARVHAESALQSATRPADQVALAVALLDAMAQQAATASGPQRDSAWAEVAEMARQLQSRLATAPRSVLLDVQSALVDQTRLQQLVREIDIEIADETARRQAQDLARSVQRELEQIRTRITRMINQPDSTRADDELSGAALLTLRYNIEYQATRALLQAGLLYPASEQASRADVMVRVEQQLQSVLQSVSPDQPLWWTIQADRLLAARSVSDWNLVSAIAASLPEQPPDALSRERLQSEMIQVRIAQNRLEEASRLVGNSSGASSLPELDMARLQLYSALSRQPGSEGSPWQQRALELARQVESAHGDYWGRRASLIVVGAATTGDSDGNLDLLLRIATEAQRKKQWSEAIKALDAAFAVAVAGNNSELAWTTGFRAAAILQDQQQYGIAATRYEELASRFAENPEAHAAWLMACWNLSRTIGGDQALFDKYQQMLEDGLQTWPDSSSADQFRIWLAAVRQRQRQFGPALALLAAVKFDSPLLASAVEQIRQLIPMHIGQARSSGEETMPLLIIVARLMESALAANTASTTPQSGFDRDTLRDELMTLLAEMRWFYGVQDTVDTVETLASAAADRSENRLANHWRVLQIVRSVWTDIPPETVGQLLGQLTPDEESLQALRTGLSGAFNVQPAPLACKQTLLIALDRFQGAIDAGSERNQYLWYSAAMEALVEIGDTRGLELATRIAPRYPRDSAIQLGLGQLLLTAAAEDTSQAGRALAQWRKIASASRPQSNEWFTARLNVARLLAGSGQREEARKMLEYLQAVPPGWKNAANAADFEQLLGELKK
jgi:hypothetical protein